MTHVVIQNGNFEGGMKKFKQGVARSGVPSEFKKREHYTKPGVERKERKRAAIRNASKHNRRDRAA